MRPYGQRPDNHRYVLNDNDKHCPRSMHRAFKRAHRLEVRLQIEKFLPCAGYACQEFVEIDGWYCEACDESHDYPCEDTHWYDEPLYIVATPLIVRPFMAAFARAFMRSRAA